MATALVTGATGFVGSWVARELVEAGHTLRILRRKSSRLDAIEDLTFEDYIGDFTDKDVLDKALQGVDWVFHVAAVSAYWRNNKETLFRVNVDSTRLLLQACERAKIKRFIFTSSAGAVGYREDGHTADENTYFNFDPRVYPYGLSKFLAEAEVYKAIGRGVDSVILNPVVVIGPGDLNQISGSLIIEMVKGKQPFLPLSGGVTMVDVRDVAKSHVAAAEKGRTGERYLIGTVDVSHRAFFKLVAKITDSRPPRIPTPGFMVSFTALLADIANTLHIPLPGEVEGNQLRLSKLDLYFDCRKAWKELHQPEYDLTESITDTYQWYREHGYL